MSKSFLAVVPTYMGVEAEVSMMGMYIIGDMLQESDNTYEDGLMRRTKELFGRATSQESACYINGSPWFFTGFVPHVELAQNDYVDALPLIPMFSPALAHDLRGVFAVGTE